MKRKVFSVRTSIELQSSGIQRETARRNQCGRLRLLESERQRLLNFFIAGIQGWEADSEHLARRSDTPEYFERLAVASKSVSVRTSATNFVSNGETLSFRQTREEGQGKFKSVTGTQAVAVPPRNVVIEGPAGQRECDACAMGVHLAGVRDFPSLAFAELFAW